MNEIIPRIFDSDGYSPIQDRYGVREPELDDFPPLPSRIDQDPDPHLHPGLGDCDISRVTYQKDDLCNLHCPGCYIGKWLEQDGTVRLSNPRHRTTPSEVADQLEALPSVQEFFLLGAEPTMLPEESAQTLRIAAGLGLTIMSITNGQGDKKRNDQTFSEAIEEHGLHKLTVSIDSIDPETNDFLRGKSGALAKTLETIRTFLEQDYPVKAQITVWQANYATVLSTVEQLYELGVRGFAFHCGSVEGIPDYEKRGLNMVEPLAWRALYEKLYEFTKEHKDTLRHFNVPLVYLTKEELQNSIFQDEAIASQYFTHVQAVEDGSTAPLPIKACPAYGTPNEPGPPQIYVYANDKPTGEVSICNVHTGATNTKFARWNSDTKKFDIIKGESNQMTTMLGSPHLCPAMSGATGGLTSDRVNTVEGDLYHGCRYWSNNQVPNVISGVFGKHYEEYARTYSSR